jgi:hypothetical protein
MTHRPWYTPTGICTRLLDRAMQRHHNAHRDEIALVFAAVLAWTDAYGVTGLVSTLVFLGRKYHVAARLLEHYKGRLQHADRKKDGDLPGVR